jgi:hypothetical protein
MLEQRTLNSLTLCYEKNDDDDVDKHPTPVCVQKSGNVPVPGVSTPGTPDLPATNLNNYYDTFETNRALKEVIEDKRIEALQRRAKKAMKLTGKIHETMEKSRTELCRLTQNIADCASAMRCHGDEINTLEMDHLLPSIFQCSREEQYEYTRWQPGIWNPL